MQLRPSDTAAPLSLGYAPQLNCDQRAEEELAEALESNLTLLKLTADLRSTRARDLSSKLLLRNQAEARAQARAGAAAAAPLEHGVQTKVGLGLQPAGLQHSVLARPRRRGRAKVGVSLGTSSSTRPDSVVPFIPKATSLPLLVLFCIIFSIRSR